MTTQTTTQTRWTIDPTHSEVGFSVRHLMISTVRGSFPGVSGTIVLDEESIQNSIVEVEIDAETISTGVADRDAHLRSADFFDVENHPSLHFRSARVNQFGDRLQVHGTLSIRGVEREVILEVEQLGTGTDPWGNRRVAFRAETKIQRQDFGLTWNQALEAGGVLVSDEVRIAIELQAVAS